MRKLFIQYRKTTFAFLIGVTLGYELCFRVLTDARSFALVLTICLLMAFAAIEWNESKK